MVEHDGKKGCRIVKIPKGGVQVVSSMQHANLDGFTTNLASQSNSESRVRPLGPAVYWHFEQFSLRGACLGV